MGQKLRGHFNYFGVTDNSQALYRFEREVNILLFKWLNRRSQRRSFTWDRVSSVSGTASSTSTWSNRITLSMCVNDWMKRLVREIRRQASVGGGSQRYKVKYCDTLEPKGRSNREYKVDLSIEGVLSTRQLLIKPRYSITIHPPIKY